MTMRVRSEGGHNPANVELQNLSDSLNAQGRIGWELVSTESLTGEYGQTVYLLAIFKRPKN